MNDLVKLQAIVGVLKTRFNNLNALEVNEIAIKIIEATSEPKFTFKTKDINIEVWGSQQSINYLWVMLHE